MLVLVVVGEWGVVVVVVDCPHSRQKTNIALVSHNSLTLPRTVIRY